MQNIGVMTIALICFIVMCRQSEIGLGKDCGLV